MSGALAQEASAPPDLFESKLRPPPARAASVSRSALVDRIAADDAPITSIVAPPGYGKTTLLVEWARRQPERVAWLSIDRHDNDLAQLLSYATAALNYVEPVDRDLLRPGVRRRSASAVASQISNAMAQMSKPVVLMLDHVELLEDDDCLDTIAEVALHLPEGSRLAMATRGAPPIPVARMRAGGSLVEVGVDDLVMTDAQARTLLTEAGVDLDDTELDKVMERTEGWPVGLYLAALALKSGGSRDNAGVPFSGDDRLMADYLRSEVLAGLSDDDVRFLTRTSILERMSGSLCDAMLETTGTNDVLEVLATANLLLVPLDRRGEWYRYHHLFRDLLRAELQRREPDAAAELHARAAEWCEANDEPASAMDHARAAGDVERANRLFLVHTQGAYSVGHADTVRRWMTWFEEEDLLARYPAAAALGALMYSATGASAAADRWAAAAEHTRSEPDVLAARAAPDRILPDGSTLAAWRAVMRMSLTADGLASMRRDAELALDELGVNAGFRSIARLGLGLSYLFAGDDDTADRLFEQGIGESLHSNRIPGALVGISERGLIAAAHGRWDDAAAFADSALALIDQWPLDDYAESALAFSLAARVALHNGDATGARRHLVRAVRIRPILTYSRPTLAVHTLYNLALAYAALADTAGAREVLRQAQGVLRQRPDLGVLVEQVAELQRKLDDMRVGVISVSSLTPAELRLVPFLPTHLTFRQIAERLYLSRNTVKTHSISIYQKLGVSSRGEAITRLQDLGLLDA